MNKLTTALVLLLSSSVLAEGKGHGKAKGHDKGHEEEATKTLTQAEEAINKHDAAAFRALLDDSYLGASVGPGDVFESADAMKTHMEKIVDDGGTLAREKLWMKTDKSGDAAWYIADYAFTPKGAAPHKLRASGVLVRHGKEWKLAMSVMTALQGSGASTKAPDDTKK